MNKFDKLKYKVKRQKYLNTKKNFIERIRDNSTQNRIRNLEAKSKFIKDNAKYLTGRNAMLNATAIISQLIAQDAKAKEKIQNILMKGPNNEDSKEQVKHEKEVKQPKQTSETKQTKQTKDSSDSASALIQV